MTDVTFALLKRCIRVKDRSVSGTERSEFMHDKDIVSLYEAFEWGGITIELPEPFADGAVGEGDPRLVGSNGAMNQKSKNEGVSQMQKCIWYSPPTALLCG